MYYLLIISSAFQKGWISQSQARRVVIRSGGQGPPGQGPPGQGPAEQEQEIIRGLHSAKELRELQLSDPDIKKILQWREGSSLRPERRIVTPESPMTRALWQT